MPKPTAAMRGLSVAAGILLGRRRMVLVSITLIVGGQYTDATAADGIGHSPNPSSGTVLHSYSESFLAAQTSDGVHDASLKVQAHFKVEIAMALAAHQMGNIRYAESTLKDLRWVISNRLDKSGREQRLPSGHHQILLETKSEWYSAGFVILRG